MPQIEAQTSDLTQQCWLLASYHYQGTLASGTIPSLNGLTEASILASPITLGK